VKYGLLLVLLAGRLFAGDMVIQDFVDYENQHPSGDAPHSFDKSVYDSDTRSLPIGVFDSGIGGLTVLEAILALDDFNNKTLQPGADGVPDFANEKFIYFGDQANMPYGNYPKSGRTDYLRELVLKDVTFLLGRNFHDGFRPRTNKPPVKAIVIACNTATAYGLDDIRTALGEWGIKLIVVGVVEAGARGVRESTTDGDEVVGVMATAGTCASEAYPKMITSSLGLAGRSVPPIIQQGGVNFAGVIEGDPAFKSTIPKEAMGEARMLLDTVRKEGHGKPLGTVILGCTHYPLVSNQISDAFETLRKDPEYAAALAPKLNFVDPARLTAAELFRELARERLRLKEGERCILPRNEFFMSIPNPDSPVAKISTDGGLDVKYKYSRLPGNHEVEDTINVPMQPELLPIGSRKLVQEKLPLVWLSLSGMLSMSE